MKSEPDDKLEGSAVTAALPPRRQWPHKQPESQSSENSQTESPQPPSAYRTPPPAPGEVTQQLPLSIEPIQKRKPLRRSTQPFHLLFQDASRQYILGYLSKKTESEIAALFNDRKKLHADLQLFSNDFVLSSARDRLLNELDENGKESLKDVNPESEIIKLKFDETAAINRSFGDAVEDLRFQFISPGEECRFPEELLVVFKLWDQANKTVEITDNAMVGRGGRQSRGRSGGRGGHGRGNLPRHFVHRGPGFRDIYPRERDKDYRDKRPEEHYRDPRPDFGRRDYERGQDFRGPQPDHRGLPSSPFGRDRFLNRRDGPYHRGYDERIRDQFDRRPDDRYLRDHRGMPPPNIGPNLPMPQPQSTYEAPPMPPNPPTQVQQTGYDYQVYNTPAQQQNYPPQGPTVYQPDSTAQSYQNYYGQYPQEPQLNGNANAQYHYHNAPAQPIAWDTGSQVQAMALHMASFSWNQPGRHSAIPLPIDFMSGPSSALRLSMPEPHEVLGVIRGVIIRDAQGNIGLSQYNFTTM